MPENLNRMMLIAVLTLIPMYIVVWIPISIDHVNLCMSFFTTGLFIFWIEGLDASMRIIFDDSTPKIFKVLKSLRNIEDEW